ncbi:hypothetical protein [Sinorhizobium terangae]|uniref:hypothetical protein n=1 Tax=Sinorhizobium terangae TaxID=110322 RepID=UPI0024B05F1E|nr:hypothetical protein [Sinorhizobium terangae]WFU51998.1 hypothetical protein QA637_29295 [Sinorhizobium terangae]
MSETAMQASNHWGVELNVIEPDRDIWTSLLKPPFDPYIEEIHDEGASYLAVRSSAFDGLTTQLDVHTKAKGLIRCLNAAMAANAGADPVTPGAVVEFSQIGSPKRHQFIEGQSFTNRSRFYPAELTVRDAEGNIIETPPVASKAQDWMRAAAHHPAVASAMEYLSDNSGWGALYNAYEALDSSGLALKAVTGNKRRLFTQTANALERHRKGKVPLPSKPMPLWEARSLITGWLACAANEVLQSPSE